ALDLIHPRVVNLRKNQLVAQTERVIAAAIKCVWAQTFEIAHSRQHHVAEPVEKFIHSVAAKRDAAAYGHALAELEISDRFLGPGNNGTLAGDLPQFHGRHIEQLDILAALAQADVDDNLGDFRHGHGIFVSK